MGSIVYDFLTESFLFNESAIEDNFHSFTENEIKSELRKYREFILKNIENIEQEIINNVSELKVLSSVRKVSLNHLKQSSFYIEQYILNDPLFPFTHVESESSTAIKKYHQAMDFFDLEGLVAAIRFLKSISFLVATDYVKILPISYLHEPPDELPILMSDNLFSDVLPKNILEFFHNNVKVQSMRMNGNLFTLENSLYPCRSIHINFPKDEFIYSRFYNLFESEVLKFDKETRKFHTRQYIPSIPPDDQQFQYWVVQSINQAAKNVFDEIYLENAIAARYNASYMSSNRFAFDLMQQSLIAKETINDNTTNLLMNFDLPFLDEIDFKTLLNIRNNDGEVFRNFRVNLDKNLKELRGIDDIDQLKRKFENAIHEINEVQLNDVNQKIEHLKKQVKIDAIILLGGFLGNIQTGGYSLVASAMAAAKGYKDWNDYYSKIKNHPAYFLWEVKKQSGAL